ncbi:hypothetical protein [Microbacterium sp. AK031]|uniref:hypothetical protein n=1 Tax=Microbacterium sp. AK031 TaxID=2723076 RepID=UPI002169C82B|nr:hypothetical protein [Microbacterium sp. AK031]MCS3843968.1 hypothetical protein [Microbacterium sp. AK031]
MSRQSAAALLPEPIAPAPRAPRRLKPVSAPARRSKPKLAYALIALGGAAAIGIAQIGLSLAITHDSFVLADLTSQQRELNLQASALEDELAGTSSPQLLAIKAAELGMVVAGAASYLRLSDSAVLGANAGADGKSTIDPNGTGAVHNALLNQKELATAAADEAVTSANGTTETVDPDLPPPITDGLPSPTTR